MCQLMAVDTERVDDLHKKSGPWEGVDTELADDTTLRRELDVLVGRVTIHKNLNRMKE